MYALVEGALWEQVRLSPRIFLLSASPRGSRPGYWDAEGDSALAGSYQAVVIADELPVVKDKSQYLIRKKKVN